MDHNGLYASNSCNDNFSWPINTPFVLFCPQLCFLLCFHKPEFIRLCTQDSWTFLFLGGFPLLVFDLHISSVPCLAGLSLATPRWCKRTYAHKKLPRCVRRGGCCPWLSVLGGPPWQRHLFAGPLDGECQCSPFFFSPTPSLLDLSSGVSSDSPLEVVLSQNPGLARYFFCTGMVFIFCAHHPVKIILIYWTFS